MHRPEAPKGRDPAVRPAALDYEAALRDLLHFYDRARGAIGHGEGWTAADVVRLEEIRAMVATERRWA